MTAAIERPRCVWRACSRPYGYLSPFCRTRCFFPCGGRSTPSDQPLSSNRIAGRFALAMGRKKKRSGPPKCGAKTEKGPCIRPPGHDGRHLQPPANASVPRGGHRPRARANSVRSVAPGAPFVTRQKISPRRPTAPAGPGPTVAQLNEIQRLRDKTGVLCDRPRDREQAESMIAALRAYLEDDIRAA